MASLALAATLIATLVAVSAISPSKKDKLGLNPAIMLLNVLS
jgi:hypothetical protein